MAASDSFRKRNNYKLISDPELKKGSKKIYRINGKAGEGVVAVKELQDPRAQKTVLGISGQTMKVPRFKYDKHWVGPPPERDVFIIGLNENVKGSQLKDVCSAIAPVQSIRFHRHPKTKAFLGAATVCFCHYGGGKKAAQELDGMIVGSCYIRAELDDQGEHLRNHLELVIKSLQEKDGRDVKDGQLADDSEELTLRRNSITESVQDLTESENELNCAMNSSCSIFESPSLKLYPFSVLNASSSIVDPLPDLRGHSTLGPDTKKNMTGLKQPETPKTDLMFPPLPPMEVAPPLPPVEPMAPPLPPLPPLPADGPEIENISSDDEDLVKKKQYTFLPSLSHDAKAKTPESKTQYDPALGLQSLLRNTSKLFTPLVIPSGGTFSSSYELAVEEVSGDDSPVMVYKNVFEPIKVESISDSNSEAAGDDMEVCSDDEAAQIELNVKPVGSLPTLVMQPSLRHHSVYTNSALYTSSSPLPFIPRLPSMPSEIIHDPYNCSHLAMAFSNTMDLDHTHLPVGGPRSGIHLREETGTPAKNTKEAISQEVLSKALVQLKSILLNDVQKKLVEVSAFSVLDGFWEKCERDKQVQKADNAEQVPVKPPEPYRRMLPGLKLSQDTVHASDTKIVTPRKRLLNFKIPLVNRSGQRRDQNISVVTRRRILHEEEQPPRSPSTHKSYITSLSDVSSVDEFSSADSAESDDEEEEVDGSDYTKSQIHIPQENREYYNVHKSSDDEHVKEQIEDISSDETLLKAIHSTEPEATKLDAVIEGHLKADAFRISVSSPRPMYKRRSSYEEENIVFNVFDRGPNWEEVQMFRLALSQLKSDGGQTKTIHWSHYPDCCINVSSKKCRVDHVTGCGRSEGYYKIDVQEKIKYLPHHRVKSANNTSKQKMSSSGRVNRANQRRLASVYSGGPDISNDLAKYNQLKARKKLLKFAKSTIHNWGLFAMENIPADEMVIEYIGEVVRQTVADERERRYEAAGVGSSYLFRVDHDYIIDATKNGNLARFINHCCDPNCYAKVISFGMQKKIIIYSKRDIAMGEEITYDYKFPIEEDKIPCLCGAPNCRGTLN